MIEPKMFAKQWMWPDLRVARRGEEPKPGLPSAAYLSP